MTACVLLAALSGACRDQRTSASARITPEYDQKTGRLKLLKYDSNGNGVVDTWSYMDGPRVVRIEIDEDEDGTIDRWEYYDANQALEKLEVALRRDGRVTRVEHYEHGRLASAEEDADGDGAIDRWETYDDERLSIVAFDTNHRGKPDRRLIYGADGSARVEVDPAGTGQFVAANSRAASPHPR